MIINGISIVVLALGVFSIQKVQCQSLGKPAPGYNNTFGTAISTGLFFNKDAYFWGLGVDYSRMLNEKRIIR